MNWYFITTSSNSPFTLLATWWLMYIVDLSVPWSGLEREFTCLWGCGRWSLFSCVWSCFCMENMVFVICGISTTQIKSKLPFVLHSLLTAIYGTSNNDSVKRERIPKGYPDLIWIQWIQSQKSMNFKSWIRGFLRKICGFHYYLRISLESLDWLER